MNLLMILPWLNYPLQYGGDQAIFNEIRAIKDDVNLTVLVFAGHSGFDSKKLDAIKKRLNNVNFVIYSEKSSKKWGYYAVEKLFDKIEKKLFGKKNDFFVHNWSRSFDVKTNAFSIFLNKVICQHNIQIVQVEMIPVISTVLNIPESVKKIFVHHELRYVIREHYIEKYGDNPYWRAYWKYNKILEAGLLNEFDCIIALSDVDKDKLKKIGVYRDIQVSNVVVETPINRNIICNSCSVLTFVGPENQMPNREGVNWFLKHCWNKLLRFDDEYQLRIIGNWSLSTKKKYESEYRNVKFLGFVENLADAIRNTIMIVPITIGSGIRMKILEAGAIGVPVVTTSIGVEGIPYNNEKECLVRNTPDDFVNGIIELRNQEKCQELVENAQCVIKNCFTLENLREKRLLIYHQLLEEKCF